MNTRPGQRLPEKKWLKFQQFQWVNRNYFYGSIEDCKRLPGGTIISTHSLLLKGLP